MCRLLNSKVSQRPVVCGQKPSQKVRHRPSSVKSLMPLSEAMILSIANVHSLQQVHQPYMSQDTTINLYVYVYIYFEIITKSFF